MLTTGSEESAVTAEAIIRVILMTLPDFKKAMIFSS